MGCLPYFFFLLATFQSAKCAFKHCETPDTRRIVTHTIRRQTSFPFRRSIKTGWTAYVSGIFKSFWNINLPPPFPSVLTHINQIKFNTPPPPPFPFVAYMFGQHISFVSPLPRLWYNITTLKKKMYKYVCLFL
jgi:hypothetical protein